jgi:hypothetical protein
MPRIFSHQPLLRDMMRVVTTVMDSTSLSLAREAANSTPLEEDVSTTSFRPPTMDSAPPGLN